MSDKTIEFYFDFMSPYAYLALHRLVPLADKYDHVIDYRPISIPGVKLLVGNTSPATREMPVKIKYIRTDLARWAARYGIELRKPTGYDSRRLNCVTYFAREKGDVQAFVAQTMKRVWADGASVESDELLSAVASTLGWKHDELTAYLATVNPDEAMDSANREAVERGVFGSPTMIVGEQSWWGNDRLDFLEQYLQEQENS